MDDMRNPEPDETVEERLKRRLRTRPKPDEAAAQRWLDENREAFADFSRWYEENGSPLDEYRQF